MASRLLRNRGTNIAHRHRSSTLPAVVSRRNNSTASGLSSPGNKPLQSILIANRGEIALRVKRTAVQHGIRTTTIYTDPDRQSQHALSSPFAYNLGDPSAYLDGDRIIELAKRDGCEAIHPGYGFLSENSTFARKCMEAGLIFIGPPWKAVEAMGDKSRSKTIMTEAGVPCIPGYHGENQDPEFLATEAGTIGYPVLLKAVKGGGGKGMRIATTPEVFQDQLASAKSEARNSFGDDAMLVEKYITSPRHIEVQIFADKHGNCVALGERDCSIQRRHQKVFEESPAPNLDPEIRKNLWEKARAAALAVGYEGAGTVEFIFDSQTKEFFFMEMNTRLQVEHPVTEMVTGQDLVHWQILVAQGEKLPLTQEEVEEKLAMGIHAIEARIYAENPEMGFIPSSGTLTHLRLPQTSDTVRVDAGFVQGDEISSYYDPMIAKLIVSGSSRTEAIQKMHMALGEYEVTGPTTSIEYLKKICQNEAFLDGNVDTGFIEKYHRKLLPERVVSDEVLAQVALGALLAETSKYPTGGLFDSAVSLAGFGSSCFQTRLYRYTSLYLDGQTSSEYTVEVQQVENGSFHVSVNGNTPLLVQSSLDPASRTLTTFFSKERIDSTIVQDDDIISLFQHGHHYRLRKIPPIWMEKALGTKDVTHSVLAPMPCKVLRVDVKAGQSVKKDQALVVVESMKMETIIRSPSDGVIAKVVHTEGDICKTGTALVEFEE
ncbi:MAG: hypothetical protein M1834_004294 [Cirrosporium novae-zelandiae]|nr:MAG: hypothetical protein M1834_004294 [Cirrosporium novae-zelandiae]